MFELDYRIIKNEYDDFIGQNGFFQIKCNEQKYGEIYPKELELVMDKVSLYDWFERLARVIECLQTRNYVVLSDVESYNTWIEFCRNNEDVIVSIVKADKEEGSRDIEFNLKAPITGEWDKQVICYNQLKTEIMEKLKGYIEYVSRNNKEIPEVKKMKEVLKHIQEYNF